MQEKTYELFYKLGERLGWAAVILILGTLVYLFLIILNSCWPSVYAQEFHDKIQWWKCISLLGLLDIITFLISNRIKYYKLKWSK
jgi:hypothetical protein